MTRYSLLSTCLLAIGMVTMLFALVSLFSVIPQSVKQAFSSKKPNPAGQPPSKRDHFKNWLIQLRGRANGTSKSNLVDGATQEQPPLSATQVELGGAQATKDLSLSERGNRTRSNLFVSRQSQGYLDYQASWEQQALHPMVTSSYQPDEKALTLELKVIQGQQPGLTYVFTGGALGLQGIISRGTPKQIALPDDAKVSMPHAMLDISYRYGQENRIRDLGSKNGTLLNGFKLPPGSWHKLKDGDLLQFGDSKFRYHQSKQELSYENDSALKSTNASPIQLIGTNRWLISRHKMADFFDLESNDTTISVPHAYIRLHQNGLLEVRDVSSGNGVRLQGRKIKGKESIFNGDMIQLGRHTEIQVVTNISGIPDKINNKWQRLNVIARGGMADLYRVRHLQDGKICALKIPHPSKYRLNNNADAAGKWGLKYRELFQRECQLTCNVYHPNLVQGVEWDKIEGIGLPYLVLDYINGPSIHAIIEKVGVFSVADAADVAIQVSYALKNLHSQQKYVHCDIKPSNILIDKKGNVYLIDLGIATSVGEIFSHFGVTKYLPKEVLTHAPVYADTDIYSLGQTLFEMLAARSLSDEHPAQQSPSIKETAPINQHTLNGPATLLRRNIRSPQMQKIIAKCITEKRANRYQDIDRLIDHLMPFREGADLAGLVARTGWSLISSHF